MLKALVTGLFNLPYTFDWPRGGYFIPSINLKNRAIGHLHFGDHLDTARAFGRPDAHTSHGGKSCSLLYTRSGLLLQFDRKRRFEHASLFVAAGPFLPEAKNWIFCRPLFADGLELSSATTEASLRQIFGAPHDEHRDEESTDLLYRLDGRLSLEFELLPAGTLCTVGVGAELA